MGRASCVMPRQQLLQRISPKLLAGYFFTKLAVPWVYLQFVIVVFPDHTHLLFLGGMINNCSNCFRPLHIYVTQDENRFSK